MFPLLLIDDVINRRISSVIVEYDVLLTDYFISRWLILTKLDLAVV